VCDISGGLDALHRCHIVHNDIKCSNILLFSSPRLTAKVADFGCSVLLASTNAIARRAGTLLYAPIEAYSHDCLVHPSRDVFSFGIVVLYLGDPIPGEEDAVIQLKSHDEILQGFARDCLRGAPARVIDLALLTLRVNANERPGLITRQSLDSLDDRPAKKSVDWLQNILQKTSMGLNTIFNAV